jgi:hypothetical protein
MSTKYGPLIKVVQQLDNHDNNTTVGGSKSLRDDFLNVIDPYFFDNGVRLGYLLTIAKK